MDLMILDPLSLKKKTKVNNIKCKRKIIFFEVVVAAKTWDEWHLESSSCQTYKYYPNLFNFTPNTTPPPPQKSI